MTRTLRLTAAAMALSLLPSLAPAEIVPPSEGVTRLIFAADLVAMAEDERDALLMLSAYWIRASVDLSPAKLVLTPIAAPEALPGPAPDLTNVPLQDTPAQLIERARDLAAGNPAVLDLITLGSEDPAVTDVSAQSITLQLPAGEAGAVSLPAAQGQISFAISTDTPGLRLSLRGADAAVLCAGEVAPVALCEVASPAEAQLQLVNTGAEAVRFTLVVAP